MMELDLEVKAQIEAVILERLGVANVRRVDLSSIEISEENSEISITVFLNEDADPNELARAYFGLTGDVRRSLGSKWRSFFPVITPIADQKACA